MEPTGWQWRVAGSLAPADDPWSALYLHTLCCWGNAKVFDEPGSSTECAAKCWRVPDFQPPIFLATYEMQNTGMNLGGIPVHVRMARPMRRVLRSSYRQMLLEKSVGWWEPLTAPSR
ncbi:uncharacterized protein TrAFT101_001245 [Trichoderma asperellum]|uniref:uncharacterized protein n=1 Tax=Trichoderma asperellum TaxID=101201 RepID=UPI00332B3897|nr:hypothetical protein TrAFT101_001245 [Trichoderma asperellum]